MSAKHTPEPWGVIENKDGGKCFGTDTAFEIGSVDQPLGIALVCRREDADRIAACVNACAGMDNPADEIARLQRVDAARESELERMIQWMEDKGISWLATLRDIKEARIAMQKGASVMGCPNCDGTGFYGSTSCSECRGTGHAKAEGRAEG